MKLDENTLSLLDSFYMYLTHDMKDKKSEKYWVVKSSFTRNGRPVVEFKTDSLSSVLAPFGIIHNDKDLKYIEEVYRNEFPEGEDITLKKDIQKDEYTINGHLSFEDFVSYIQEKENSKNTNI